MPSSSSPVLRAADLRLLHACTKIARVYFQKLHPNPPHEPSPQRKAWDALNQAENVAYAEMLRHNIVPALSAQELRDEDLEDDEIPLF